MDFPQIDFRRLTIRTEIYTHLLPIPIYTYYAMLASDFDPDFLISVGIGATIGATIAATIGVLSRYLYSKRINARLRRFVEGQAEAGTVLYSLLRVPAFEAGLFSFRWIFGLGCAVLSIHLLRGLTPFQAWTVLGFLPFTLPINVLGPYHIAEEQIRETLSHRALLDPRLQASEFRTNSFFLRTLLIAGAVAFTPAGMLGILLYIVASGHISISHPLLHLAVIFPLYGISVIYMIRLATAASRRALQSLGDGLARVSDGNLSIRLPVTGRDEIGLLSHYADGLASEMRKVVGFVQEQSRHQLHYATQLRNEGEQLLQGTQRSTTESGRILSDLARLEELGRSIDASARSQADRIRETDRRIGLFSEEMQKASQEAEERERTNRLMEQTAHDVTEKGEQLFEQARHVIDEIGQSTDQIRSIIETIGEVADRVNLLSLNASIEAARAGEHGRGFAVVASEVSKLADRTQESTKEISSAVSRSVSSTERGLQALDELSLSFDEGMSLIRTYATFSTELVRRLQKHAAENAEMRSDVAELVRLAESISQATQEQSQKQSTVRDAVKELGQIEGHAAELAAQLSQMASLLGEQADEFNRRIGRYSASD
ncbi:methyl-accepting chemotaxis protein [Leptonema illini]|uniref:Methyl-accepting chemotaxis sensory transducer n=1 Tax=Leptonema illini DSM 21528 TaxID=929563 RepID=H2CBM3_9LEPT|nr:HAMP domain-containing methyl-accepting chemotaxis protein [Leptonema illini]EHQ07398.1 methyl-accepting chemotaxis sensory transducer [Leptonema illini DSM 21528]